MPKNSSKAQPKKNKPKKTQPKAEPKPFSITSSKYYWVFLTLVMVVFGSVYGYMMKATWVAITLLLVSVLSVIGIAFYLKFYPSNLTTPRRVIFLFVGASVIGFCIWAAVVLALDVGGFWTQIESVMSDNFFAITSMIICLAGGAFIGDVLGKNSEKISMFFKAKFGV